MSLSCAGYAEGRVVGADGLHASMSVTLFHFHDVDINSPSVFMFEGVLLTDQKLPGIA
jgi:hypothetical protein